MHGLKSNKKPTDYGIQLRAKQKAKRIYVIQETQFHNYYLAARKLKGLVGDNLMSMVERRLDNVVYLSGFALSRSLSKQTISHKHILVNGKSINVPSYSVKVGDAISLSPKTSKENLKLDDKDFKAPSWLDLNKKTYTTKVLSLPPKDEIGSGIDVNLIIEYYSR